MDELDEDLLRQCKNLKAIVKFGVGTDNIDLKVCEELRIKVGRCLGTNSNAVAELTVGMMFACARDLVANAITVKNGGWIKPTGFELKGKKTGNRRIWKYRKKCCKNGKRNWYGNSCI